MSTTTNVHPATNTQEQRLGNRLTVTIKTNEWPRNLKLGYKAGGPTFGSDHEVTVFIGSLSAEAIRKLAGDLDAASADLFAYANWLDANGNDKMEG